MSSSAFFILRNESELFLQCMFDSLIITKQANLIGQLNKHVFAAHAAPVPAGYRHNFLATTSKFVTIFCKKVMNNNNY